MADLDARLLGLLQQMGPDATSRMLQMDVNRGAVPGNKTPGVEGLTPAELGLMDRYAWGQQSGLGGLPVAAVYEALKAASQVPALSSVLPTVGRVIGAPNNSAGDFYKLDQTSSPASVDNILALLKGALSMSKVSPAAAVIGEGGTSALGLR